jgi:WhiB family redox-sensing transcriptional regulator
MLETWLLPPPLEWEQYAKCLGEDTDLFFPPRSRKHYRPIAERAKSICRGLDGQPPCPVRLECLAAALDRHEEFGIFGGLSHRERNALVRKAEAFEGDWRLLAITERDLGVNDKWIQLELPLENLG